ncbi:alpha/beta fold hydrolase [Pseudochryseolinea flava]|uniref:Alpha/beta hydrolase n=1 Tax=Pseudochryseolinea flava TaxID=2059302 RepID=A0A364Y076_9BACT|nr:alpha/beta hydrolase [Pseudochryseolinea flava]RAW00059.1 alpha/beta hydrolase [Pseudochryseolinea flava]
MKSIMTILFALSTTNGLLAQSADSSKYFKSFDGTQIHYQVKGDGFPILLVHGFVVNGESWKRTMLYKDLLASGYQVIVVDLRGNGKSDRPHHESAYLKDAEANDLMQLISFLKIKRYAVVGYSRGAIITSRLLVLDQRVTKAVLGGMGSAFTDPEWPRRLMFYRALSGEPVPELEGFIKYVKESGLDQRSLALMQYGQPSTSDAELSKNVKPVLVICGDKDEDNGSSEALFKMIPHAQYKRPPGDHNNTVRTAEFSNEVLTFLNEK